MITAQIICTIIQRTWASSVLFLYNITNRYVTIILTADILIYLRLVSDDLLKREIWLSNEPFQFAKKMFNLGIFYKETWYIALCTSQ